MTVAEYTKKYNVGMFYIKKQIADGRLPAREFEGVWEISDVPPEVYRTNLSAAVLSDLDEYSLGLIWLNSTFGGDTLTIRAKTPSIPNYFASAFGVAWRKTHESSFAATVHAPDLLAGLRAFGFTGISDVNRVPPPVGDDAFMCAVLESHASFFYAQRYDEPDTRDKAHAFCLPSVTVTGTPNTLTRFSEILFAKRIAPRRKVVRYKNKPTCARIDFSSYDQLSEIYSAYHLLSADAEFWKKFYDHITSPVMSYAEYQSYRSAHQDEPVDTADESFIAESRTPTEPNVVETYRKLQSIKATSEAIGISVQTVRRILIQSGEYKSPAADKVLKLYDEGKTVEEIAEELNITRKAVLAYIPYSKTPYATGEKTDNAYHIAETRARKKTNPSTQEIDPPTE